MQYTTGTVSVNEGSSTVTGSTTDFVTAAIQAGWGFKVNEISAIYTIASVVTTTTLLLSAAWASGTVTNQTYQITTDYTPNFEFAELNVGDKDWPVHMTQEFIRPLDTVLQEQKDTMIGHNLLTNSGFGVWSNASAETTGSNLITNGDFTTTITSWGTSGCTIASVAGGQSGNCLELTRTSGDSQQAYQTFAGLTVGKLYQVSAYVKSGTSSNEAFSVRATGWGLDEKIEGTSVTTSWVQYTVPFEAIATSHNVNLFKETATAGNMLFDTVVCYEINPGCVAADALGPDGWYKTGLDTAKYYREHTGTNTKDGSYYSLKNVNTREDKNFLDWPLSAIATSAWHYSKFAGRTVTLGCWVKQDTANEAFLYMYDGSTASYSDTSATTGSWVWLELTVSLPTGITRFECSLGSNGSAANTATFYSQPILIFGDFIGEGNYQPIPNEIVVCDDPMVLYSEASISTHDVTKSPETLSNGRIPKGCRMLDVYFRLSGSTPGDYMGFRDVAGGKIGVRATVQVASIHTMTRGSIWCDANGDIYAEGSGTLTPVTMNLMAVQV